MSTKLSQGAVKYLAITGPLKNAFNLGFIDIYSGSAPTSPNDAATGVLLVTVSNNSTATGITFDDGDVDGTIKKAVAETWSGTAVANGTAGYFRLRESSDTSNVSSPTKRRLDGSIGTSGSSDMTIGSLTITSGAPFVITAAVITTPQA